jgi:hypothetical protein
MLRRPLSIRPPFIYTRGNYPEILCSLKLTKLRSFQVQNLIRTNLVQYTRGNFYICLLGLGEKNCEGKYKHTTHVSAKEVLDVVTHKNESRATKVW